MEVIKDKTLASHSFTITHWITHPSIDNSSAILVEINISLFSILQVWTVDFSISILLQNNTYTFQ
jgi:hypothetical protein